MVNADYRITKTWAVVKGNKVLSHNLEFRISRQTSEVLKIKNPVMIRVLGPGHGEMTRNLQAHDLCILLLAYLVVYAIIVDMYLRTTKRKNKDGSVATYYQLAHNVLHPETNQPTARVIHNFGRADQLDRQQLVWLCQSIARICELKVTDPHQASELFPETPLPV